MSCGFCLYNAVTVYKSSQHLWCKHLLSALVTFKMMLLTGHANLHFISLEWHWGYTCFIFKVDMSPNILLSSLSFRVELVSATYVHVPWKCPGSF